MNKDFGDLNRLIKFARENGVSLDITYLESGDELSVEVFSASKEEGFYIKKVIDVDWFIEKWNDHVRLK